MTVSIFLLFAHCNSDSDKSSTEPSADSSVAPVLPDNCDLSETRLLDTDMPISVTSYCDQVSFCVENSLRETVHSVTRALCEVNASAACDGDVLCVWNNVEQLDQSELDSICTLTTMTPTPHSIVCDRFLP